MAATAREEETLRVLLCAHLGTLAQRSGRHAFITLDIFRDLVDGIGSPTAETVTALFTRIAGTGAEQGVPWVAIERGLWLPIAETSAMTVRGIIVGLNGTSTLELEGNEHGRISAREADISSSAHLTEDEMAIEVAVELMLEAAKAMGVAKVANATKAVGTAECGRRPLSPRALSPPERRTLSPTGKLNEKQPSNDICTDAKTPFMRVMTSEAHAERGVENQVEEVSPACSGCLQISRGLPQQSPACCQRSRPTSATWSTVFST